MRAMLKIVEGPGAGFRKLVAPGDRIVVGRSSYADVPCVADLLMSREHFALQVVQDACVLKDLNSSNGTEVNGVAVDEPLLLQHGDEIYAGDTVFRVEIHSGNPGEAEKTRTEGNDSAAAVPLESTLDRPLHAPPLGEYRLQQTAGGLFHYSGLAEQLPPEKLAERLSRRHPAWLILDRSQVEAELPETDQPPAFLFNFLDPAAAAAGASPVILSAGTIGRETTDSRTADSRTADSRTAGSGNAGGAAESPDVTDNETNAGWADLITQAWGSDALVVLHTDAEPDDVVARLQAAVNRGQHGAVSGLCWPSVLYALLAYDRSGTADALVDLMETVLIESPDAPQNWELFSRRDLSSFFEHSGLQQQAEQEAVLEA